MNCFCKKLVLNNSNYPTFKTLNYDIQKHVVICADGIFIPGVGQWHIDSPESFLWIL